MLSGFGENRVVGTNLGKKLCCATGGDRGRVTGSLQLAEVEEKGSLVWRSRSDV